MRLLHLVGAMLGIAAVALLFVTPAGAQEVQFVTAPILHLPGSVGGLVSLPLATDKHLSLVVSNFTSGTLSVFRGDGTGTFTPLNQMPSATGVNLIAPADYDGDGLIDLVVSAAEGNFVYFQRGKADGSFTLAQQAQSGHDPIGVAAADMDGDGNLDVLVSLASESGGGVNVLLGDGHGHFTFSTDHGRILPAQTFAVGSGDFDEDGNLDVAAVSLDNTLSIMLGDGKGALGIPARITTGHNPGALAIAKLDADDHLDIVVAETDDADLAVFHGDGHAGFQRVATAPVGTGPGTVVLADVDGDGALDAVTSNFGSGDISVVPGKPGGGFGDARHYFAGFRPAAAVVGDFDEDGKPDIAVVSQGTDAGFVSLLFARSNRFAALESLLPGATVLSLAAGDIDGDGFPDLAATLDSDSVVHFVLAAPAGGFREGGGVDMGFKPNAAVLADLDRDGRIDVVAASTKSAQIATALAQADGAFAAPIAIPVAGVPSGLAVADLDGDGILDIAVPSVKPPAVSVLFGNADGTFQPALRVALSGGPVAIASGDFDHDGLCDLARRQPAHQCGDPRPQPSGAHLRCVQVDFLDRCTAAAGGRRF